MKNTIRIVGGKWRSRLVRFKTQDGLRPTPDRVRETLFNWLSDRIIDARCFDLCAGSGSLGFEALSRGAKFVLINDASREVSHQLKDQLRQLQGDSETQVDTSLDKSTALDKSAVITSYRIPRTATLPNSISSLGPFDLVFIDPPFHQCLAKGCAQWLIDHGLLAKNALVYIERERRPREIDLPESWRLFKSKEAGQIRYELYET